MSIVAGAIVGLGLSRGDTTMVVFGVIIFSLNLFLIRARS